MWTTGAHVTSLPSATAPPQDTWVPAQRGCSGLRHAHHGRRSHRSLLRYGAADVTSGGRVIVVVLATVAFPATVRASDSDGTLLRRSRSCSGREAQAPGSGCSMMPREEAKRYWEGLGFLPVPQRAGNAQRRYKIRRCTPPVQGVHASSKLLKKQRLFNPEFPVVTGCCRGGAPRGAGYVHLSRSDLCI
jgi:hypothetical protein